MNSIQTDLFPFPSNPVYLSIGRHRLFNLTSFERIMLYMLLVSLMIPLVLRRGIHFYTFDPFLLMLYVTWFFRVATVKTTKSLLSRRKLRLVDFFLGIIVWWSLLAIITSVDFANSLHSWLLLMRGVWLYIYLRFNFGKIIQPTDLQRIIYILLLVECTLAMVQFATNSRLGVFNDLFGDLETYSNAFFYTSFGQIIRVVGTFHNPNLLANWIILLLPSILAGLYFGITKSRKLDYLLLILALFALIFTFSRSAWASLGVILITMFVRVVISNRRQIVFVFGRVLQYGIVLLILTGFTYIISSYWFGNFGFEVIYDRFSNISGGSEWRLAYVNLAFQLIQRFPIIGVGLGNFSSAITEYRQALYIPHILASSGEFSSVHNVYLLFFAETGIIGGILWTFLSVTVTIQVWRLYTRMATFRPSFSAFGLWLLAAWVGIAFNSNFEAVFFHPTIIMLIFIIIGLIVTSNDWVISSKIKLEEFKAVK